MKFSQSFIYTSKEAPSDAVLPSHIYLIRGGFIQSIGAGLYNFLPLGKKVLDKVRAVAKEELDAAGCQEVELSFVTPSEFWKESGRFEKYGKELLRFKDRKDAEFVLGPTHEEMMVNLVRQYVKSYKQLPVNLYQIKTKFRDEIRPRFGLMRGREFLMKDGYSFHKDEADMIENGFNKMEETYSRIFRRLGLDFRVVEADSGAIGGSGSKEFMVLANSGEDTIVVCTDCDYGANIEAAKREAPKEPADRPQMSFGKFLTPDIKTIEDLSDFFKIDPYFITKIVAKKALYDEGVEKIVLFALRGSDELQEVKACNAVDANDLIDVSEEELEAVSLVPVPAVAAPICIFVDSTLIVEVGISPTAPVQEADVINPSGIIMDLLVPVPRPR
jgi:prolyl-tRNA synthetase